MKLSYRGIKYEPHHEDVEVTEGHVSGKYRGAPWRVHRYQQQGRSHQSHPELTYRGIRYHR
ncbi:MAG: DUF4278 domain-containing protein [Cyanobacteria bacterium P01_E01_bin.42]